MELQKTKPKRTRRTSLICNVCGDTARGMNFDVITCMSCKAFFRRHILRSCKTLHCLLDNNCDITKHTRGGCSSCRLKKCYALGMNPKLIRAPYKPLVKKQTSIALPEPKPLSLLNHDRSTLSFDEWNLLSNIIHSYDEQNITLRTQCTLKEQSCLPAKLRSKRINTLELVGSFYTAIEPFIECSSYFQCLPSSIRRMIIQNNLNGTGALNSLMGADDAKVFENESHVHMCNEIYGADYVKESYRLSTRIESNRTLLKILLIILTFSTNCSIVAYDHSTKYINISIPEAIHLIRIQNIFVTMLWKYLTYQYGYMGAVKRFDYLIKNYLDTLNRINANVSTQHWEMVDIIVEKTTHSLAIDR
ncbi:unnamed protein product [Adineta steineri]|uniref:Nuclear receptor domain-containing protein n=1 Tax=Adineta steineri TaxID=433720 RepID=A0A815TB80_9BILA|nr:unnamed protein product [Adineta steineri]CAF4088793.1 unnamed protein product [Adineta steineri]